jgi:hypothetical protein
MLMGRSGMTGQPDGAIDRQLTAVNFRLYSMKSMKWQSYPQGLLTPLKHSVIGFRKGGGAVLCCVATAPRLATTPCRAGVSELFQKPCNRMKNIMNTRKLSAGNSRRNG